MKKIIIRNNKVWRVINVLLMISIVLYSIYLIYKVWTEILFMESPLLPKYAIIYMNGFKINLMCFLIGSLIPAVYLTFKHKYIISMLVILVFLIFGLFSREHVLIYQNFYWLTEHL